MRITGAQVERLEREIDAMNASLSPLKSFVLPGGTALAAHLHLARAVARRAESLIAELAAKGSLNPAVLRYANRLSDHLFVMARAANDGGMGDVLWVPGEEADGGGGNPQTRTAGGLGGLGNLRGIAVPVILAPACGRI